MKTRLLLIAVFALSLFALAPTALAQSCGGPGSGCTLVGGQCVDGDGVACPSGGSPGSPPVLGGSPGEPPSNTSVTLINPLKSGDSLESFLGNILDFVIRIGAIIVVLMLVYVGYLFVIAQGKEEKIREARQTLLWTLVGALILLGAKAISVAITETVKALGQ